MNRSAKERLRDNAIGIASLAVDLGAIAWVRAEWDSLARFWREDPTALVAIGLTCLCLGFLLACILGLRSYAARRAEARARVREAEIEAQAESERARAEAERAEAERRAEEAERRAAEKRRQAALAAEAREDLLRLTADQKILMVWLSRNGHADIQRTAPEAAAEVRDLRGLVENTEIGPGKWRYFLTERGRLAVSASLDVLDAVEMP